MEILPVFSAATKLINTNNTEITLVMIPFPLKLIAFSLLLQIPIFSNLKLNKKIDSLDSFNEAGNI